MIIYKDAVTGDELFSDTYPMKLIDECIYEVKGRVVTESTSIDDRMFGGNASAEGGDEGCDNNISTSGVNIVIANRLIGVPFTKKQYQLYLKTYVKRIIDKIEKSKPEDVAAVKGRLTGAVKKLLEAWTEREYEFFVGESQDVEDGHISLMYYPEDGDGLSPFMLFFKDGLKEMKV